MHGDVFKDGYRTSVTFKIELFPAVGNGKSYKQLTVAFAFCCVKSTVFTCEIKIGWNDHALKTASDTISCLVDAFIISKTPIPFCFTNILFHFENVLQKWKLVTLSITSSWVLVTEATSKMFWKFLLIKCSKNSWEGVF